MRVLRGNSKKWIEDLFQDIFRRSATFVDNRNCEHQVILLFASLTFTSTILPAGVYLVHCERRFPCNCVIDRCLPIRMGRKLSSEYRSCPLRNLRRPRLGRLCWTSQPLCTRSLRECMSYESIPASISKSDIIRSSRLTSDWIHAAAVRSPRCISSAKTLGRANVYRNSCDMSRRRSFC